MNKIKYFFFLICAIFFLSPLLFISQSMSGDFDRNLKPGDYDFNIITKDGLERHYILHVPDVNYIHKIGYDNKKLPLVIVLHGTYGTGKKMQIGLGFDKYADEYGFLVAYPDAYKINRRKTARWNDGRETLKSSEMGIDDVSFIKEMINHIDTKTAVDKNNIFATGASNGGIMTYRLGCEASDIFAAIAPVIGNIADSKNLTGESFYDKCKPTNPISILAINGDEDPFIPFNGGEVCKDVPDRLCEGGFVVSVEESVNKFVLSNGCKNEFISEFLPALVEDGTFIEKITYNCSNLSSTVIQKENNTSPKEQKFNNLNVLYYIVHGGGHTWPPREPHLPAGGKSTQNLDATKEIVEFFKAHPKNNQ